MRGFTRPIRVQGYLWGLFLGTLFLLLLLSGCSQESSKQGKQDAQKTAQTPSTTSKEETKSRYGGIYRRPLRNEPPTLDPVMVTDIYAVTVANEIFDGLVQFDGDLNVLPALAQSWEGSRDGLTWTFRLREGVKFHNGRVVTIQDVIYSFTRLLDPTLKSPNSWLFERVKGAQEYNRGEASAVTGFEMIDEKTLKITLAEPFAPFITLLGMTQARIVPREEVEKEGEQFGHHPVGTGPFRFASWEEKKVITLEANPEYFEGRPYLDGIRFVLFSGATLEQIFQEFAEYRLENSYIPLNKRSELIKDPRFTFVNNQKVRQALNYALDKVKMNQEIHQNRFVIATGILPPGMPGHNPELLGYSYNPEKAKQLLAEAGYPEGKGLPELELWTSAKTGFVKQEHEAIQKDLAAIGVTIHLKYAPDWATFLDMLTQGKAPMYRYAWYADFPDPDNFLYVLLYSNSANNYARYKNPQVDALLIQARAEIDYLERIKLYREAEKIAIEDAPWINLVYSTYEHLFQPSVRGIEVNALGETSISMKKIWLDKPPDDVKSISRQ
jgi:peptide/nickel transport system substrate-binding protein/oligopeptide transport system substrate-binding protein